MVKTIYIAKEAEKDWDEIKKMSQTTKEPIHKILHRAIKIVLKKK